MIPCWSVIGANGGTTIFASGWPLTSSAFTSRPSIGRQLALAYREEHVHQVLTGDGGKRPAEMGLTTHHKDSSAFTDFE
jgi:hypothetical protein